MLREFALMHRFIASSYHSYFSRILNHACTLRAALNALYFTIFSTISTFQILSNTHSERQTCLFMSPDDQKLQLV